MSSSMGLCHRNEAVFTYLGDEPWGQRAKCDETHRVDKPDACQVHIVLRILINQFVIMNRLGLDVFVTLMSIRRDSGRPKWGFQTF